MREALRQGAAALVGNPLRASLGALSIAVAVTTIVVTVAALDGVRIYARQQTAKTFGSDTFLVAQVASPGRVSRRVLQEQLQRNPPIRRSELKVLQRYAGDMVLYAPNAQTKADVSSGGRKFELASITGTTSSLAEVRDLSIAAGRFFLPAEDVSGAQVAVLGADIVDELFPGQEAIGRAVRMAGRQFLVIGVQERLGNSGGASLDKYVWVPLVAFERAFGAPKTLQFFATAPGDADPLAAEDRARVSLRASRALGPGVADTFDILTPDAARTFVATLSERIGAAAGPISLMALLAAIVVVTNTVLVSVTQRTREIGVRRALGAPRAQILREVLAESALMSVCGGIAGTAVAAALVSVLARVLGVPIGVSSATVVFAVAASAVSGLAAGWYPARRATRIDVIMAIRAE